MTEEPTPTKTVCPNCQGEAIKEGNKIICEKCDATFTITRTGSAKVKEIGRLDSLEKRLDRVESILPVHEPDPAKLEPDPAKLEPDPADEESILGSE